MDVTSLPYFTINAVIDLKSSTYCNIHLNTWYSSQHSHFTLHFLTMCWISLSNNVRTFPSLAHRCAMIPSLDPSA